MKLNVRALTTLAILPVMLCEWAAIAPAANTVYVGASYGLFRSTDAGATWTMVNIPLNNPLLKEPVTVTALAIDPHNPSNIYCIGNATARASSQPVATRQDYSYAVLSWNFLRCGHGSRQARRRPHPMGDRIRS